MNNNLKEALEMMLWFSDEQVLSEDFKKINFKKKDWFLKYHWTEKMEEEFKKWLSKFLKEKWEGISKTKPLNKKDRDKIADDFILQYGCVVRELNITDFMSVVPWEQLEEVMSKNELKKFNEWMFGQTTALYGVYRSDLYTYLRHLPNLD